MKLPIKYFHPTAVDDLIKRYAIVCQQGKSNSRSVRSVNQKTNLMKFSIKGHASIIEHGTEGNKIKKRTIRVLSVPAHTIHGENTATHRTPALDNEMMAENSQGTYRV